MTQQLCPEPKLPMDVRAWRLLLVFAAGLGVFANLDSAQAERIENDVAIFAALDKVTARISKLEVPLNEPVRFGSLTVTPRTCFTRAPTEPPKTTSFVEVLENELDGEQRRIFSGWMFAESPGLNAVEHPVFDVWLTGCKGGVIPDVAGQGPSASEDDRPQIRRRRRRRVRR